MNEKLFTSILVLIFLPIVILQLRVFSSSFLSKKIRSTQELKEEDLEHSSRVDTPFGIHINFILFDLLPYDLLLVGLTLSWVSILFVNNPDRIAFFYVITSLVYSFMAYIFISFSMRFNSKSNGSSYRKFISPYMRLAFTLFTYALNAYIFLRVTNFYTP